VRSVPMSAGVRAAILPCWQERRCAGIRWEPGRPVNGNSLRRRFVSAAKRAGLPVLRFHDLRHCFGTQAILAASGRKPSAELSEQRRRPESNRCRRLCRPLRSHSATSPGALKAYRAGARAMARA
jgi:integrase